MPGFLMIGLTSINWLKMNEDANHMFFPMKCAFFPQANQEVPWEGEKSPGKLVQLKSQP